MSKNLDDLRATLFATIEAVRSGQMELDKARAINEIGKTIVDTAKVEVDYIRAVDGDAKSNFTCWPGGTTPAEQPATERY